MSQSLSSLPWVSFSVTTGPYTVGGRCPCALSSYFIYVSVGVHHNLHKKQKRGKARLHIVCATRDVVPLNDIALGSASVTGCDHKR